jgi:hypothetical protein
VALLVAVVPASTTESGRGVGHGPAIPNQTPKGRVSSPDCVAGTPAQDPRGAGPDN